MVAAVLVLSTVVVFVVDAAADASMSNSASSTSAVCGAVRELPAAVSRFSRSAVPMPKL